MNIASLLSLPFEMELKTKISERMINEALAMKELRAPIKKVSVQLMDRIIGIHVQTSILFMKNLKVNARILGIKLSPKKSTVHCELIGTSGKIINTLLSLLGSGIPQISINDSRLDIDITDMLLRFLPNDAAGILGQTQVHILSLEAGFLNLGIKKT